MREAAMSRRFSASAVALVLAFTTAWLAGAQAPQNPLPGTRLSIDELRKQKSVACCVERY
jgi:hypothetical protein